MKKQLEDVAFSLIKVDSLPEEALLDILEVLSIRSRDDLKKTFHFKNKQERTKHIYKKYVSGSTTMVSVGVILREENHVYNSLWD